jgi:hypothetical protein
VNRLFTLLARGINMDGLNWRAVWSNPPKLGAEFNDPFPVDAVCSPDYQSRKIVRGALKRKSKRRSAEWSFSTFDLK